MSGTPSLDFQKETQIQYSGLQDTVLSATSIHNASLLQLAQIN